jgi:hypothetical protein
VFVEVSGFDARCIKSAKSQGIPHDRQSEAVITKGESVKISGAHFTMPFASSGSTGVAAILSGRCILGIEREAEYVRIAAERLERASRETAEA